MISQGLIFSLLYFPFSTGLVNKQVLPYGAYTDYLEKKEKGVEEVETRAEYTPEHFLAAIELMRNEMVSTTFFSKNILK